MFRALLHLVGTLVSSDGAWWILALDGILFIPLVFALFFYPAAVLIGLGVAVALTVGTLALMRAIHTYQHRHGVM
jgi:hypothetical protein